MIVKHCFSRKNLFLVCLFVIAITSCTDSSDRTQGVWYRKSDLDGPVRSGTASFVIGNYGYVCGGYRSTVKPTRLNDVWKYDMENDFWTDCASMPDEATRRNLGVGFSIGTKGYVTTGYDGENYEYLKDTWEYDSQTDSWKRVDDFIGEPRSGAVAFSIGNYGYVGTGKNDDGQLKDFYRFDPNAASGSQWTKIEGFGGYKRDGAVAFVINDVAYICTGNSDSSGMADDLWRFDPSDTSGTGWTKLRDIVDSSDDDYDDDYTSIVRSDAVCFVIDNLAYLVTGQVSGSARTNYWIYNPSTDLWYGEDLTPFEGTARMNAVAFSNSAGTRGFVATGGTSSARLDDVWELKPYEWEED